MNRSDLQALTQSPEWESYLDYLDGLKEAALRQMMQLDMNQHEQFIALNARLILLDQISCYFEIDSWDNGTQDQENMERIATVDGKYRQRFSQFLKNIMRR